MRHELLDVPCADRSDLALAQAALALRKAISTLHAIAPRTDVDEAAVAELEDLEELLLERVARLSKARGERARRKG